MSNQIPLFYVDEIMNEYHNLDAVLAEICCQEGTCGFFWPTEN